MLKQLRCSQCGYNPQVGAVLQLVPKKIARRRENADFQLRLVVWRFTHMITFFVLKLNVNLRRDVIKWRE